LRRTSDVLGIDPEGDSLGWFRRHYDALLRATPLAPVEVRAALSDRSSDAAQRWGC
jgi:hypothetical protein